VTQRYLDRFAGIPNLSHRVLAGMTSALDTNIGRVLDTLKSHGLEKDTIVWFLSDNGAPRLPEKGGTNGPLSGWKVTMYEGGIRIPSVLRWPGTVPPGQTFQHPVSSLDILPTYAHLAGAKLPSDREFDGVDILPWLTGRKSGRPHDILFWRAGRNAAVRYEDWKLMRLGGKDRVKLFNLADDLAEMNDRSKDRPKLVKELLARIDAWEKKTVPPAWEPQVTVNVAVHGENIDWDA
jgi:arylsulfatase A-like enzyme